MSISASVSVSVSGRQQLEPKEPVEFKKFKKVIELQRERRPLEPCTCKCVRLQVCESVRLRVCALASSPAVQLCVQLFERAASATNCPFVLATCRRARLQVSAGPAREGVCWRKVGPSWTGLAPSPSPSRPPARPAGPQEASLQARLQVSLPQRSATPFTAASLLAGLLLAAPNTSSNCKPGQCHSPPIQSNPIRSARPESAS